jgi:glycerol-3-phosphate dehydrogenase (NAD(P)+)
LVEGAHAAAIALSLARKLDVDMPITEAVAAIIAGKLDVPTALANLMARPIITE